MTDFVEAVCRKCSARLKVRSEIIDRNPRCPQCNEAIFDQTAAIAKNVVAKGTGTGDLPATSKQLAYAESLGCEFSEPITRAAISELIDAQLTINAERRDEEIERLESRETEAVEAVRRELLEEMADDPQVSKATPRQMIDSLDAPGLAAVLITIPFDQIDSFEDLRGVPTQMSSSEEMSSQESAHVLMGVAQALYKKYGLKGQFAPIDEQQ